MEYYDEFGGLTQYFDTFGSLFTYKTMQLYTYFIAIPPAKRKEILSFLQSQGVELHEKVGRITKGNFLAHEKPSDFAGIWTKDERTADNIRAKAWQRKK